MKRLRLSLTGKVLFLVGSLIFFQLGSIFFLMYLQGQAEEEAQRALKAHDISNRINLITQDVYRIWELVDNAPTEILKPSSFYTSQFAPVMFKLRREYFELDKIAGDDPDLHRSMQASSQSLNEAQLVIESVLKDFELHNISNILSHYEATREHLRDLFKRTLTGEFALISEHERKFVESSDIRQAANRKQESDAIIAICLVDTLGAFVIAFFLVKDITLRLSVLSDNAKRLARHAPLHTRISGHDEISELDGSFHQMAQDLDEAAQAKQELVNMITHDLRSPLTAIRGTLELFKTANVSTEQEKGKRLIDLADRNSFRMMGLINDLLDIEKINSGMMTINCEEVCLAEIFENVKLSVDAWISESGIDIKIQDTDLFVRGDPDKLERVLFNLVSNSIKFSPPKSIITLSAAEHEGKKVQISVADEGKGIGADQLRGVFERFRQAHAGEAKGGSGLGLTICKSIVELHGGNIWATSEVGKGTTFHFTIPAS
ncbi:MAG TPA: HAMP domain-containing sensor histidine kinase [Planktothrix sp.]|jgi:signal transduction histidine kinase